jgi:DNA-binding NarL/FixJ family response regulator
MNSDRPVHVLSVCDDNGLRSSRELVLKVDKYVVHSHPSNVFWAASEIRLFDVAIICQSVDDEDAARLIERLSQYNPNLRVLRLAGYSASEAHACGPLQPDVLLEAVRDLVANY